MKMSQKKFVEALESNELHVAFIGMSNVGKTRISRMLAKHGALKRVEVDELIGNELQQASITSLAEWMGFPYQERYAESESRYLEFENSCTITSLKMLKNSGSLAIDTTGSVIYLPRKTLHALKEICLVIHIAVAPKDVDELYTNYIAHPKPVVWNGMYEQNAGESQESALQHSYKKLLKDRLARYNALADVSIPRFELYKAKTPDEIFASIKRRLPQ